MRITKESARVVSAYAGALSNGYVQEVGTGADIGNGARILDGNSQTVWLGSPREAVAYYLGQVDAFAHARGMILADYPARVAEIRRELNAEALRADPDGPHGEVGRWYQIGVADGRSRVEYYVPEIRGAGMPRA